MKRGFTVVELLIVILIISILTAISYPMFTKYKIRAYNAAALSDLKAVYTTELAFYSTYQEFVQISTANITPSGRIFINVVLLDGNNAVFDYNPLSAHVLASSKVDASRTSLVLVTKNTIGTKYFAQDNDFDVVRTKPGVPGQPLQDADVPASTPNQDDLVGWDNL